MKKVIFFTLCLAISITNFGQTNTNSGSNFFNRKVSLGTLIGVGQSGFKATESNWTQTNLKDSFNSVKSKGGVLLTIGQEMNVNLNNIISYRQRVLVNFGASTLEFDTKKSGIQKLKLQNIAVSAPTHFVFHSTYDKYRPFILFGATLIYNFAQDKDIKDKFQIKPLDLTADIGIGIEIKMKKFLIAPELNFSHGLLNLQNTVGTSYSSTFSKLSRQNILFTITVR